MCKINKIVNVFTEKLEKSVLCFVENLEKGNFLEFEKTLGKLLREVQMVATQEVIESVLGCDSGMM